MVYHQLSESVNFNQTLWTNFHLPAAETLFTQGNCPSIYNLTESAFQRNWSAAKIVKHLQNEYKASDPNHTLSEPQQLHRITSLLAQDYLTTNLQETLDSYCQREVETNSSLLYSAIKMGSYPIKFLFSTAYDILAYPFTSESKVVDCSSNHTSLNQEEYTFCSAALHYFAEIKTEEIKKECSNLPFSPTAQNYLNTLGDFLVAAEQGRTFFDPNATRALFQKKIVNESLTQELKFPLNFSDYLSNFAPQANMPSRVQTELEASAAAQRTTIENSNNDEL